MQIERIRFHPLVQIAWATANAEACAAGAKSISPAHFLLGLLTIVDPSFRRQAQLLELPEHVVTSLPQISDHVLKCLGITVDRVIGLRKDLRRSVVETQGDHPLLQLHRSDESRQIFKDAQAGAAARGEAEVGINHLASALIKRLPNELKHYLAQGEQSAENGFSRNASSKASGSRDTQDSFRQDCVTGDNAPQSAELGKTRRLPRRTRFLDRVGVDLVLQAKSKDAFPHVHRRSEIKALVRYLNRTSKRNVLIVGEPGVGKTALVEGLAAEIAGSSSDNRLPRFRLIKLSVSSLKAQVQFRGDLERTVSLLVEEASSDPNIVLFIDEFHQVVGGGGGTDTADIANLLKPVLERDLVRCIGATTNEELDRFIRSDRAFLRRFQVLKLQEPGLEEATEIASAWAKRIEDVQFVSFDKAAIRASVELTMRYVKDRALPDVAIDVLENAAVRAKISTLSNRFSVPSKARSRITEQDVVGVLEEQYEIVIRESRIASAEGIADSLREIVVGQEGAIKTASETIARKVLMRESDERPLAVLMFVGPTGVGKTLLASSLDRAVFGESNRGVLRVPMGEFKERHSLYRLSGAPPGYVGHEESGILFRHLDRHPRGVVVLDEMEKAHVEVQDYFLQIFDSGETTDSSGRVVDFKSHVFVMTTNNMQNSNAIGFEPGGFKQSVSDSDGSVPNQTQSGFRREFMGRVDAVVRFEPLSNDAMREIAHQRLDVVLNQARQSRHIDLSISADATTSIIDRCLRRDEGARGVIRMVDKLLFRVLESALSSASPGSAWLINCIDGEVACSEQ